MSDETTTVRGTVVRLKRTRKRIYEVWANGTRIGLISGAQGHWQPLPCVLNGVHLPAVAWRLTAAVSLYDRWVAQNR